MPDRQHPDPAGWDDLDEEEARCANPQCCAPFTKSKHDRYGDHNRTYCSRRCKLAAERA